jgi:hypothetical protein
MGCNQIKTQNNQIVLQVGSDPIGEMSCRKATTQQTAYCIGNGVTPRSGSCQQYRSLFTICNGRYLVVDSWRTPVFADYRPWRVYSYVGSEGRVKSSFAGSSQGRGAISDRP